MENHTSRRQLLTSARWGNMSEVNGDNAPDETAAANRSDETAGMLLRRLRLAEGLTQEELAERAGVSVYSISNIERSIPHKPRVSTLQMLAQALQLSSWDTALLVERASLMGQRAATNAPVEKKESAWPLDAPALPSFSHSSLIGRNRELDELARLLHAPNLRLLTLIGPAGVGKTRLAVEALHMQQERDAFPGGRFFVDLAPLHNTEEILTALAHAVGLSMQANEPALHALQRFERERAWLVLLDNFEHVLPGAILISDLLSRCPQLRLLITSRRRLNVRAEQLYMVHPLGLPPQVLKTSSQSTDSTGIVTLETLQSVPSVALFISRAQSIHHDFDLTNDNMTSVADLCRHLDGLPLAIELAAARLNLFTPQELLGHLKDDASPLNLLANGPLDAPQRQRTLRNALRWSYHLLSAEEQRLFRTLSVFRSYATSEAVQAIHSGVISQTATDAFQETLRSLIESSMVNIRHAPDASVRIGLLEAMRHYAREVASQDAHFQRAQAAHAQYYLTQAEVAAELMHTFEEGAWLRRLDHDLPELRAALAWFAKEDVVLGVRLASALRVFWIVRGHLREGLAWFATFLAPSSSLVEAEFNERALPQPLQAQTLVTIGQLLFHQGAYADAQRLLARALDVSAACKDEIGAARALSTLGMILLRQGATMAAHDRLVESFNRAAASGDLRGQESALVNLAAVAWSQRQYDEAERSYEEALAIQRQVGDLRQAAYSLQGLAGVAYTRKQFSRAMAIFQECLEIQRQLGDAGGMASCLNASGQLAHALGMDEQATIWLDEALAIYERVGNTHGIAKTLGNQGDVLRAQGYSRKAFALYQKSLRLFRQNDELASYLEVALEIASVHPDHSIAAQLLGATQAACDAIQATFSEEEAAAFHGRAQTAQAALGAYEFATYFARGQNLNANEMIELALSKDLSS